MLPLRIVTALNASLPIRLSTTLTVNINSSWGSLYISSGIDIDISSYGFVNPPFVIVSIDSNYTTAFAMLDKVENTSVRVVLGRGNSRSGTYTINLLMWSND